MPAIRSASPLAHPQGLRPLRSPPARPESASRRPDRCERHQALESLPGAEHRWTSTTANFTSSPNLFQHSNHFDTRVDFNPNEKDQIFLRFSYADDPQYIPGLWRHSGWRLLPAGHPDREIRPGRRWPRPTCSPRTRSTWPARVRPPSHHALRPGGQHHWAFRRNTESRTFRRWLRTAAFPPSPERTVDPGQQ